MAAPRTPPNQTGRPDRGRDRRHLYPGRSRRFAPTFTEDECAEIVAAAAATGLTPTGFCAEAALSSARGVRSAALDPAREELAIAVTELFDARVAVGRIGTNLNQTVAAFHATHEPPEWLKHVVALCERRMRRLDEAIDRLDRRRV